VRVLNKYELDYLLIDYPLRVLFQVKPLGIVFTRLSVF
jgi:hypothetical protein